MLNILRARLRQGHRTSRFPDEEPTLPPRFRGRPLLDASRCPDGCSACIDSCPTQAITATSDRLALDMARCLFCADCIDACPEGAIAFSSDFRLAERARARLVVRSSGERADARELVLADKLRRMFGRS